jgi:hypothetical protein
MDDLKLIEDDQELTQSQLEGLVSKELDLDQRLASKNPSLNVPLHKSLYLEEEEPLPSGLITHP